MLYILTVINVLAALGTIFVMIRVHLTEFKRANEVAECKAQVVSLRGKVGSQERWDEVKIREAVDTYLTDRDVQLGGGGGDLAQLMQLVQLMPQMQPQQQPQQQPQKQQRNGAALLGKGGRVAPNSEEL